MANTSPDKEAVRASLSKDTRNISAIWNEAIRKYNETAREDKKTANGVLITPNYKDAQAMKVFGNNEMQRFEKFRDDGKKMGKLKTLFMQNIDFIEAGSKQLLSAVSASFPPALAISTAMTFVLSGFRSVSADYDMVVNFFEDMNNFLQRVTIIAERVPRKDAYQNALMDVFASMLSLCGAARNYIVLGKFSRYRSFRNSLLTRSREMGNQFSFWRRYSAQRRSSANGHFFSSIAVRYRTRHLG